MEGVTARTRTGRVRVVDGESLLLDRVHEVDRRATEIGSTHAVGDHSHAPEIRHDVAVEAPVVEEELVAQTRTAPGLHRDAQRQIVPTLSFEERLDLGSRGLGQDDAVCGLCRVCAHEPILFGASRLRACRSLPSYCVNHSGISPIPPTAHLLDSCQTRAMAGTFVEPEPTPLALLLLGQQADPDSERGVECPGDLPAASDPDLVERARAAKAALGDRLFILGHHYQRDEVIQFADVTGDSFKLSQQAAARPEAEFIVFCGVHFMAESADILTSDDQKVILPDMAAGCSMADMAEIGQVERCWRDLERVGVADVTIPITYMNSSAAIKSFTGKHGGSVCTSSNAERSMTWAFENGEKVLFLPDQHLGRNTAVRDLGLSLDDCVVYDPRKDNGGLTDDQIRDAKVLLWRGHCSVHGRFTAECVDDVRERVPGVTVIVHPECDYSVVEKADQVGSTEKIIAAIESAPAGSKFAVGTELNLVKRLALQNPDKEIVYLDKTVCFCSTMNRIDLPHLVWALENLVSGNVVNQIVVDPDTQHWAKVALDRMLALPGPSPARD